MPRQTIPLTAFTLCDAEPGTSIDEVRRRPTSDWLPATVPGGVHEALLAASRIPDPYFDRNEAAVRWVEERDWWFRTQIPASRSPIGGRTLLVCQGLDTVADLADLCPRRRLAARRHAGRVGERSALSQPAHRRPRRADDHAADLGWRNL